MHDATLPAPRHAQITYLNCFDAKVFSASVTLDAADEARLRRLLAALEAYGIILLPDADAAQGVGGIDDLVGHLRRSVGGHIIDAALHGEKMPAPSGGRPCALMPIWRFEPESHGVPAADILLSSGRLWGADVVIEAVRVEGDNAPTPAPAAQHRFDRWILAAGGARSRQTVFPPGHDGAFVLFAAAAPA